MKKLLYFACILLLASCGGGEEPGPVTGGNVAPETPAAREAFLQEVIAKKTWRLSRFLFDDTTRFSINDPVFSDLYAQLPPCRIDDQYTWNYEFGDVRIDFYDQDQQLRPPGAYFLGTRSSA